MSITIDGICYDQRSRVLIPDWADLIRLVGNGIDGWPPLRDRTYPVAEFVAQARALQALGVNGAGEWDVLVYAVHGPARVCHPYGADHPYRQLRAGRGGRVQQVAEFSYMHWHHYRFLR